MSDLDTHPTPAGIGRLLDVLAATLSVLFFFAAAANLLGALVGGHDREQFYFADVGIRFIYFASALLGGFLALFLIRRLAKSNGSPPTLEANRVLVMAVAAVAALPWAELLYSQRVDARYFGPSIWQTTNFGALGSLAFLVYLVFRIPLLTFVRERDASLRLLLVLCAIGGIVATYLYLKLYETA